MRSEIDLATVDLVHKVQELEGRAAELKARVRQLFQLEHHAQKRPWTVFGLSVAVGALVGWLVSR